MKNITLYLAMLLLATMLLTAAGCQQAPVQPTETKIPTEITEATQPVETEAPTVAPTVVPTVAPTEPKEPDMSPMGLVGKWQRTKTEVEGDVNETPAGQVTVTITGEDKSSLRMTYKDKEFKDDNFEDRSLFIMPAEDGTGSDDWEAQVNYTGSGDLSMIWTVTLVDADTFQLEILWYMDDAPMASYSTFERVG